MIETCLSNFVTILLQGRCSYT